MSEKSFKGKISAKGMNIKEILKTGRLILREMSLDDLHETRKIVCDEQTMWAWNGAWSEEENLAGLEKQLRGYTEDGFGRWAVILKETGAFIGMCVTPPLISAIDSMMFGFAMPMAIALRFDWTTIFIVAVPCVLVFSFLSGSVPAWITARKDIVNVLKGGSK